MSLAEQPKPSVPSTRDLHVLRRLLQQRLRRHHVLDLGRADAERQRAHRAMRRGVAVAADDRRARQAEAEFRADDVHDALPHIEDRDVRHAELDDVLLQRLDLDAAVLFLDVGRRARADGRDVVVGDRDRQVRPAQLAAGQTQTLERLRAGDLVQQMPVDVENAGPVRELLHDVAVPDLVEQRAWLRFGHGVLPLDPVISRRLRFRSSVAGASPAAVPACCARARRCARTCRERPRR